MVSEVEENIGSLSYNQVSITLCVITEELRAIYCSAYELQVSY